MLGLGLSPVQFWAGPFASLGGGDGGSGDDDVVDIEVPGWDDGEVVHEEPTDDETVIDPNDPDGPPIIVTPVDPGNPGPGGGGVVIIVDDVPVGEVEIPDDGSPPVIVFPNPVTILPGQVITIVGKGNNNTPYKIKIPKRIVPRTWNLVFFNNWADYVDGPYTVVAADSTARIALSKDMFYVDHATKVRLTFGGINPAIGGGDLSIGMMVGAHTDIAFDGGGPTLVAGFSDTAIPVTFNGQSSYTLDAGDEVVTDEIEITTGQHFETPPFDVVVSMHSANQWGAWRAEGLNPYVKVGFTDGNDATNASPGPYTALPEWDVMLLSKVEVWAPLHPVPKDSLPYPMVIPEIVGGSGPFGEPVVGDTLEVLPGTYYEPGSPITSRAYQWYRTANTLIPGETETTYTVTGEDVGFDMVCIEIITTKLGDRWVTANPTLLVINPV